MRFRYIDSKGKEIALDSVEALAARIELGAVDGSTELFDAETGAWGPAEDNPVFLQLLAEAAARDIGSAAAGGAPFDPGAITIPPLPTAGGSGLAPAPSASGPPEPAPDDSATADADDTFDLGITGDLELESPEAAGNDAGLTREPPMEGFRATVSDAWEADLAVPDAPTDATPVPAEAVPAAEDQAPSGMELDDAWGKDQPWGQEDEADEQAFPHPSDGDPFALPSDGGWPEEALLEDHRPEPTGLEKLQERLSSPVLQWVFLVAAVLVMAFFGSAVGEGLLLRGLLTVGGVAVMGLVTGFFLWGDAEKRTLIPAATFGLITLASVPLFLAGTRAEAADRAVDVAATESARQASVRSGSGVAPPANAGEIAMESRALEEVIEGLDSLAVSYRLDRRPGDWLHGIYLANASRYPDVQDYWERYGRYLEEVRTQDAEWFAENYELRLRAAGVGEPAIEGLVSRGLERFMSTSDRRADLYDRMQELVEGSLELHNLLLERESDIEYTPFDQGGLSEAPVVEAVTEDGELEDEMWGLIARIATSLESVSELGETSPARLQAAMVDSIRASIR